MNLFKKNARQCLAMALPQLIIPTGASDDFPRQGETANKLIAAQN